MSHEELMGILPEDIERVKVPGPFFIRKYPGSYAVVVLTDELVTCGGEEAQKRASHLATTLNEVWNNNISTKSVTEKSSELREGNI